MPEDVFSRNADAQLQRARGVERKGLEHLERGIMISAIEAFKEAIDTYKSIGDQTHCDSAEQYMALALYEQGDVEEAVEIWEALVERGWDRPTTLNFLVRHYEQLGDAKADTLVSALEVLTQSFAGKPDQALPESLLAAPQLTVGNVLHPLPNLLIQWFINPLGPETGNA